MQITFSEMSPCQISKFLSFLYDYNVSYTFQSIPVEPVVRAILQDLINPVWLSTNAMKGLLEILEAREDVKGFVKIVKGFMDESFDRQLIPNEHYKKYCGNEWLGARGQTTKKTVVAFIEHHIALQKMKEENGLIYTNTWLQELLQDNRRTIYRQEIPNLVHRFF